ncbi:MAG: ABC transporter ATP-binding protein [Spirochaetales bacterium]|nr:ABC transporter ATP-binding protein [Spirochaetales bacterium]
MSFIRLTSVSKYYFGGDEKVRALDDVSISIEKGDFVAVCGPSGCGKTTFLYTLGVLSTPSIGSVTIDNVDVYGLSTEKRADFRSSYIGFIFQAFQLIPYLSALENVMLPLSITRKRNKEQMELASNMLRRVGLQKKMNNIPAELSGGEIQRVAIARALVNNPSILLADELTGNLDSKNSEEVMRLLQYLNETGNTIVMVTHESGIAAYASKRVFLNDGEIKETAGILK